MKFIQCNGSSKASDIDISTVSTGDRHV